LTSKGERAIEIERLEVGSPAASEEGGRESKLLSGVGRRRGYEVEVQQSRLSEELVACREVTRNAESSENTGSRGSVDSGSGVREGHV